MKKNIFLAFALFLLSSMAFTQAKLGEVACVYITTADLDSSLAVYEKLGFPKVASNTFPVPWAQASDGSLLIMMRKDTSHYIGLTYYVAGIEKVVEQLEMDGIVFTQKPKEGDLIKRYYFRSPDDFNLMLASNLGNFQAPGGVTLINMKPEDYNSADKFPNKQCGVFGEFCHPVKDLDVSIAWWKKLGFTLKFRVAVPYPHAIMTDGLMIIGLHQTTHFSFPAITYFGINTTTRIQELKDKGLKNFSLIAGDKNQSLQTWEGQHFFIFSLGM